MAKKASTAVATRSKTGTAVAANVPSYLKDKKMTGAGQPTDASEFLIPMARILQTQSPEVIRGRSQFINGAVAGDIYIKGAPKPVIKGEAEGFAFQPCFRTLAWVEWLPRGKGGGGGTGFVGAHREKPADAKQRPDPQNPERKIWVRKNGNTVVETRYVGGFLIQDDGAAWPLTLPFAGSGHTTAKQWNMLTASKEIGGHKADLWACYYRLKTYLRTKGPNSWYMFDVRDAGDDENGLAATFWAPTNEDFERGASLHKAMSKGEVGFNAAEAGADEPAGDNDKM